MKKVFPVQVTRGSWPNVRDLTEIFVWLFSKPFPDHPQDVYLGMFKFDTSCENITMLLVVIVIDPLKGLDFRD